MPDVLPISGNITTPEPLTPQARAKDRTYVVNGNDVSVPITGIPVQLHDGNEWLLMRAGLWSDPDIRNLQNETFDYNIANDGRFVIDRMRLAAVALLMGNYRLTLAEAFELIDRSDPGIVGNAAFDALMPTSVVSKERTYTAWMRSALIANGIKPSDVSADDLPHVLFQLQNTGRAVDAMTFTEVGAKVGPRDNIIAAMRQIDAKKAAKTVPIPANPFPTE